MNQPQSPDLNKLLTKLWDEQKSYNWKIMADQLTSSQSHWAKQYLLGMIGEVDEVLREINWKSHRPIKAIVKSNLARELADMTKYLLCLWQVYGYSPEDMLRYSIEKTEEMAQLYRQDFDSEPHLQRVIISDVDGTLGNWRKAFIDWCLKKNIPIKSDTTDNNPSMNMEVVLGIPYEDYVQYKKDFEENGGYLTLEPFISSIDTIQTLCGIHDVELIIYTHRPFDRYSRLWSDTWRWLRDIGLSSYMRALYIGGEERIAKGLELKANHCEVVMLEDDPGLALRAANAGLSVYLRSYPYNAKVSHPNIIRVDDFEPEQILFDMEAQHGRTN